MTSDGEALFRALCENPGDDTPRLIYADWLEEDGQPERAEFIRLQCEAWNRCPGYQDLTAARNRASQLLREFGDRWYAALPEVAGVQWGALFVRGFVDTAQLGATRDVRRALEEVFAAVPLLHLTVSDLWPGQLRDVLECPLLARLVTLQLPGTQGREELRLLAEAYERFPRTQIY